MIFTETLDLSLLYLPVFFFFPALYLNIAVWLNFLVGSAFLAQFDFVRYKRFRRVLSITTGTLLIPVTIIFALLVRQESISPGGIDDDYRSSIWFGIFYVTQLLMLCACTIAIGVLLIHTLKKRFFLFYIVIKRKIVLMLTVQILSELLFSTFVILTLIRPVFDAIY